MARPKKVILNLSLELNERDYESLKSSAGENPDAQITAWCRWLLTEHAQGGMLVPNKVISEIESSTDVKLTEPRQLVDLVQKAEKRDDGQFSVTVNLDPAYINHLTEQAQMSSMTPEQFLNELVGHVLDAGWIYEWSPEGGRIALTSEDRTAIEELVGKNFTGEQVVAYLRDHAEA